MDKRRPAAAPPFLRIAAMLYRRMTKTSRFAFALLPFLLATAASAETASYTAIFGGKNVGHLTAVTEGDTTHVDFDYKNNGRGPSSTETIRIDKDGLPVSWQINGAT